MSTRNDNLISERERDAQVMNEMEGRVEEYKKKHEAVRIELRNLKGASLRLGHALTHADLSDIYHVRLQAGQR